MKKSKSHLGVLLRLISQNSNFDQASGLRQMSQPKPVRVIAITSGKGGVGKSNISVNLATAMSKNGHQVMVMDADLGMANIDILLGLNPIYNLSHVVRGERSITEVIVPGPAGIHIVPAASGTQYMAELSVAEHAGLVNAFSEISQMLDVLIIDTAAGISSSVVSFCQAAQEVLVVVCDEPASITDAYALIKLLSREHGVSRFHVIANMTTSVQEGRELFEKLNKVSNRFLDTTLTFLGVLPYDEYLKKAVQKQKTVVEAYPRCRSAIAFKNFAQKADKWPMPSLASGQLEFFVERLILASQNYSEATA